MAKTATITIQLVPESREADNSEIGKEIMETLGCDWLLKVLNVKINESTKTA